MLQGEVISGSQIGRTIGFPTANLRVQYESNNQQLESGVYGVIVYCQEQLYFGVMNIGIRPTIEEAIKKVSFEVHLLDFSNMIYGETLDVFVLFFVRPELKFSSLRELTEQIHADIDTVKQRFGLFSTVEQPQFHIPDLLFCQLIQEQFQINRGIYNTVDIWFWKKGVYEVLQRRECIFHFFKKKRKEVADQDSRLKFGSGGLAKELEEFWIESQAMKLAIK